MNQYRFFFYISWELAVLDMSIPQRLVDYIIKLHTHYNCLYSTANIYKSASSQISENVLLLVGTLYSHNENNILKTLSLNSVLYLFVVEHFLCFRFWVFGQDMQHGIMECQIEHRRLNLIIKEATAVQLLQDVRCGEKKT